MKEVTDEKLDHYFEVTGKALKEAKIIVPERSHLHKVAEDYLDMVKNYVSDAKHFREKGDYVTAFGALNYAHAWLDAGARLGLFDVNHNSELFTVD